MSGQLKILTAALITDFIGFVLFCSCCFSISLLLLLAILFEGEGFLATSIATFKGLVVFEIILDTLV